MSKRRSRGRNHEKIKKVNFIYIISILIVLLILFFLTFLSLLNMGNSKILHNIYINGISVSSLSQNDAKEKLNSELDTILSQPITLSFEDFSVDIEPNHITGIIGRNGQGKTTLMNLIAGKFEPDEGIIEIDGKNPVTDIGTAKRIVYVAGVMSYSEMKLKKIIEEYRLMYEKFDEEFAHKLMELFGLNKKAKIKNLSRGNRQKLGILVVEWQQEQT